MKRIVVALSGPGKGQVEKRALYLDAVARPGVEALPLMPGDDAPERFDALFLTGGGDVHPSRYREAIDGSRDIDEARDALEFALVDAALKRRVPVLGVCRGFQVLNVALGGTLAQHLDGHRTRPPEPAVSHEIVVAPQSLLEGACGRGPFRVNSWHHQGVRPRDLARGARPTAVVDDLVEAFEAPHFGWLVGVQWHPERPDEVDAAATKIFDAFVEAIDRPPEHWSSAVRGLH